MRRDLMAGGVLAGAFVAAVLMFGSIGWSASPPPPPHAPPPPPPPPPTPPLGAPLAGLNFDELQRWNVGKAAFLEPEDVPGGLGPVFTENACVVCHGGATATGGSGIHLVTRFGRLINGQYDPMVAFGGPVVQNRGIGKFNGVNFVGEVVPPQATIVAQRRTVPLYGLGLVDAVPDHGFIQAAQFQQAAYPATAGVVSVVTDEVTGQQRVGKFGWKAQEGSVFEFAADAYVNEMGVTTPVFPNENCPQGNCSLLAANPAKTHPNDLTDATVQQFTDFVSFLAPPPPGPGSPAINHGVPSAAVGAGQTLFVSLGCAQCHEPTWTTGPNAVAALNNVTFAPYSDFLLHNMGSLGDGIVQNTAGPTEMRTAPLWGLRFETSFLHDGRASTPTQAILSHAGQGLAARNRFAALNATQQSQLLAFLNSL